MKIHRHYMWLLNTHAYDEFQQTIIIDDAHFRLDIEFLPNPHQLTLPFQGASSFKAIYKNNPTDLKSGRENMC